MPRTRYDLAQRFKVTWHSVAAGVTTTVVLIAGTLLLFLAVLRQGMDDNAQGVLREWLSVIDESRQVLNRLNALDAPLCSPDMLRAMRYEEFEAEHIKDIGAFAPGKMICTTGLGVLEEPFDEGTPQIVAADGTKIHINAPILISGLKDSSTILHIGRFNAIPSFPRAFWDERGAMRITLTDPRGGQAFILRQSRGWDSAVARTGLDTEVCDATLDLCVAAHRSWGGILGHEAFTLSLMVLGGAAGGGFVFLAVAQATNRRRTLLRQLKRSLGKDDRLTLAYQPIIDLDTGACVGAEALARWRDDTGTPVPPDLFLPLAEEHGVMTRLTRRVLATASRDLVPFLVDRPDFRLCLNISADDLLGGVLEDDLDRFFVQRGVAPRQIVVELTERQLTDETIGRAILERLRGRGFGIAVDDFGTGYSTLASLRAFPFTELKIDRSFVNAIDDGALKASLLPQIVDIARSLSLGMIAEGVETRVEETLIRGLKVERAQGWLYSPALDLDAFRAYVTAHDAPDR